jgi:hypothetical protein
MSTTVATTIHSATYYEQFAGAQYILYGQGVNLRRLQISNGTVTDIATLSVSSGWGHFRARNSVFLGNGTNFKQYDGTTLRNVGIRAPNSTESGGVTVAASTATPGSFSTTTLSGYQMYMSYMNLTTGEVGNRAAVGGRITISGTGFSIVFTGLPNLSSVDTEWVKVLGRTPDGGEVPYAFTDAAGNYITVGNTASTATVTLNIVDFNSELPTLNDVPLASLNKFAKVNGRIYGARPNDINIYYSAAEEDVVSGDFVGRPECSWAGVNVEAYPSGEVPTALHEYNREGWFFSRNWLHIFSDVLRQQLMNPWRAKYPSGCGGQRLFIDTPHGPFWIDGNKQLTTWGGDGPLPVDDEYNEGLLARISDAQLANAELGYLRDPAQRIDRLYIKGLDAQSATVMFIHDFLLRDADSPFGQGYEYLYTGMTPNVFVGSGYSPRQPVRDTNFRERLWIGATNGRFEQLEDGNSDNGAVYSGDYITLRYLGSTEPLFKSLEWMGDANITISYLDVLNLALADFIPAEISVVDADELTQEASFERATNQLYIRVQLTAHPADGNFNLNEPPHVPINIYGTLFGVRPKIGAGQPEAQ